MHATHFKTSTIEHANYLLQTAKCHMHRQFHYHVNRRKRCSN